MRIKSLRMKNFRQFKGENELQFSCAPEKNVTVILGDNTYGKTTLLQAFHWCFYDKTNFDQQPDFLLNYELAGEMKNGDTETVEVEIVLLHGEYEYTITRTQNYVCLNNYPKRQSCSDKTFSKIKIFYKKKDGETVYVRSNEITELINDMLPENLASYFFFDTERVSSISTRKDVAEAVKGLLGLSIIDNAVKHLGDRAKKSTVIGKFYGRMDTESEAKAATLLEKIHAADDKRAQIARQISECKDQISKYEDRKEELQKILIDNKLTSSLHKQKESVEKSLEVERQNLAANIDNFFKAFNTSALNFFAQPLFEIMKKILKESKLEDANFIDVSKTTILEIINRGRCICGRKFKEGDAVYKRLQKEFQSRPDESLGSAILRCREKIEFRAKLAAQAADVLTNAYKNVVVSRTKIQELEDEIETIIEKISGKANMHHYALELEHIRHKLLELNNKKDRLYQEDGSQKNDQERLQKSYNEIISASEANKELMHFMDYAEKIREILDAEYLKQETFIRENLESEVNKIFAQIYSGSRRVIIDEAFNVHLMTTVSNVEIESGESEGSNRVKNLAFIAGLVALAKNKIVIAGEKKQIDLSEEPYPLIMDAPFSNADEIHTTNIAKVLPQIAEQVIMFVINKDWKYAEPVLRDRIGKKYLLKKITETFTQIQ